jgi:hypothetical protein
MFEEPTAKPILRFTFEQARHEPLFKVIEVDELQTHLVIVELNI